MQAKITVKEEFKTLDKMLDFVSDESPFECKKEYDSWDVRTGINGQMEQCIIVKQSAMNGVKLHFADESTLVMTHIVPSKVMNAYFGKSQKAHKNILEVVTGKIGELVFSGSKKKAFSEVEQLLSSVKAI
jgi:hypothetical protein